MARRCALAPLLLLLVFCFFSEACQKVKLKVPATLEAGKLIGKVNLDDCLHSEHLEVHSNDPEIIVTKDGSLFARTTILMSSGKRTLTLRLLDPDSHVEKKVPVKLIHKKKPHKSRTAREAVLRRTKRRWAPQPFSIMENSLGPFPMMVQQIQSDTKQDYDVLYSINGPGVDQPPVNLFYIVPETGDIYVTRGVDREQYTHFQLIGNAKTKEGYSPESPLIIVIKVEDDNDNAPQFTEESYCTSFPEHAKAGTVVGRVNTTDLDEPGSSHCHIKYSIKSQFPVSPPRLFAIDADTGIVTVTSQNTDREFNDQFVLLIIAQDMGGQPYGLSSTGTMTIAVADINDHAPTCTANSFQGEVNENEVDVRVLCIPVDDKDLVNTPNWRANFSILQGNEEGKFKIVTNRETNEGCISVVKPLNYEAKSRYQLTVGVTNEVPLLSKTGTKTNVRNTCPVTITVRDVDEGPEFLPQVWRVRIKEGLPVGTVIYTCSAKDPETKSGDGISYTKSSDPSLWVNISPTCQVTTAKILDRESEEIKGKGEYNVTILATDQSGKTGTGILIITVDDENDNNPLIVERENHFCLPKRSLTIKAHDPDDVPNSSPFKFSLDDSSNPNIQSQWRITPIDGTSMTLEDIANQRVGRYLVPISIVDQQGKGATHTVQVDICECSDGINCPSDAERRSSGDVSLGPFAILVMVLSAVLLGLLLLFLLSCLCGAAGGKKLSKGFPDDLAQQNLIVSNTEAPGEEVMDANFKVPIHISNANVTGQAPPGNGTFGKGIKSGGQQIIESVGVGQTTEAIRGGHQTIESLRGGQQTMGSTRGGQHLLDSGKYSYSEWQNFMQVHLGEKVYLCGQEEEHRRADDYVLPYNYEGKGSVAGSVGCCSEIQGDEDGIEFSKTLEPKFRTLADICTKK